MEGLELELMTPDDVDNLFTQNKGGEQQEQTKTEPEKETTEKENNTAEVNVEELFESTDTKPESVGRTDNQDGGTPDSEKTDGSPNFYSSTASALKDDGVLPDLDDSDIKDIKTPEDLSSAIDKQIRAKFDERQKRIDDALQYGVQPSAVKQFEDTLNILDGITEESLSKEGDEGENLRKQLIYNDAINRGFSKEGAMREVELAIDKGEDIERATKALDNSKDFYNSKYNELVSQAKAQEDEYRESLKQQADKFKHELLEEKEVFKGIELDNSVRKRAYESMTKPVAKDKEGNWLTSIQKYEQDNPLEFRKKLGVIFALTDGFENIDGFIKGPVKKVVKSKLSTLEKAFNNTSRNSDGSLKFVSGENDDTLESLYGKGVRIDI